MTHLYPKISNIIYLDIFLLLIGCCGIYQLIERAGFNPEDSLLITTSDKRLVVENVPDDYLLNFLQPGDTLLSINGFAVHTLDELELLTDAQAIGSIVDLLIKRQQEILIQPVKLSAYYTSAYLIIAFTVALFFLLHGIFVLLKKPNEPAARIYHWVTLAVAMIIMTTWGRYTIAPAGLGYMVRILFCITYSFTPVLFIHFTLIFPKIKWPTYVNLLKPLYLMAGLFSLFTSISFLLAVIPDITDTYAYFYLAGFNGTRWFFILSIFLAVFFIIHSFFMAAEPEERKKILWLILGLVVGPLGFVFLWQFPQAIGFPAIVPEELILLITLIMPLTFSISIVRYHIMDIELIINRSAVYITVALILLGIYALMIAVVMTMIGGFTTNISVMTSAITIMLLAILFEPLKRKVQRFIDWKFFRVRYNYRLAQRKFTKKMKSSFDEKKLAVFTVNELDQLLQPLCIGLYLKPENKTPLRLIAHKKCNQIDRDLVNLIDLQIRAGHQTLFANGAYLEQGISFDINEYFDKIPLVIILPIRTQAGQSMGMLTLGPKRSDTRYTSEDVDLLLTITSQLGLTLEQLRMQTRLVLKQTETNRLTELNQMQSFFISSISHDLQTPLTSIRMYLDLLEARRDLSEIKRREYLQIISGESDRLSKMVHNVIDSARIERGKMTYSFEHLNINSLIKRVLDLMRYELDSRKFKVDLDLPGEDIYMTGDYGAMERALINLISNSIKYSVKEKFLSIRLSQNTKNILIEVTDRGIGIERQEQKKIFDMFYRAVPKKKETISGAGLGLSIVQHIIQAHQGTIQVISKANKGSTFILSLPSDQNLSNTVIT